MTRNGGISEGLIIRRNDANSILILAALWKKISLTYVYALSLMPSLPTRAYLRLELASSRI